MTDHIQSIVTIMSLINPTICAALFAQIESGKSTGERFADATKAAGAIFVILTISALVGTRLLHLFGVSLDAFMVAGGGVLAWMGFNMLSQDANSGADKPSGSLTNLILFGASPGTITGVITLSAAHSRLELPITSLVAVAAGSLIVWLCMLLAARFGGLMSKKGFLQDTSTRFMGLIVLAMGVQFALTGYFAFARS